MPIISKITIAKKRKDRFHVYITDPKSKEEQYGFTVSEDILIRRHLSKGLELSEEDIETIRSEDNIDKAFQKTLNYLSYRMRSEKEVLDYLKDMDIPNEKALQILDRLKELQFLDDQMFANAFVRTKKNTQKKGPKLIEQELYEKGISQKRIDVALQEYPLQEQIDNAIAVAIKKSSSYRSDGLRMRKQKLYQFLLQKGYTSNVINEAIEVSLKEQDVEDVEWTALNKQGEKALKKFSKYDEWEQNQRIKQQLYQKGFTMDLIDRWLQGNKER
ncbi:recombination regulator RecX [Evansella sp. AB-rgal1]|uniref:recombination regulator RecX n=1 Tax=Evansella sp. AB-rgal1 TaxID=3242696 RepID=UPI00359DCBB0